MRKFNYMLIFITLLIAMMSVAVAADVNDSTEQVTTTGVTQYTTSHIDSQIATNDNSNEITKKTENNMKESALNTPKTVIVDSTNYSTVFLNDSLSSTINDGDTIDVQGDIINTDLNITINKAINLTTTTGATIYLNTTGGNLLGTNPGNSFKIVNSGSYTNVTNLKFYNTQVFVINAHHVTMDNINVTVENRTVGSGVGVTSIRDNSTYVTVKNSNFYTKNNGGSSSVVLAWADYCTIDNNNITGEGNVGNLMYLTTYNINGTPEYAVDINMYNNITNNNIKAISVTGPCIGVVVTGHDNKFENNKVNVSSSFAGQWMSPTMNEQGDHDDRWEGNNYINNDIYGSFTGTKNSTIMGNTFNKTVSLPERCIFKNNNAENFTVTVRGSGCDLCGNRMYHLTVNSGVTNTMVCIDNVFLNGYEGNFTWYMHSTSSGLNKMMYRSVKAEGEPTVIEVNEDNFYDYFSYSSDDGILRLNENNIPDVAIYNINYFPSSLDIHRFYFQFQNMMTAMNKNITIIGKTNITLNNTQLLIDCPCLYFELSNFNFKYDDDYTLEGKGQAFQLDNMDFFGKNAHAVLNNITMNYTHEYSDDDRYTNPVVIKKQTGCSFIIQNSEFNINIASNSNSYGIEILGDNTQLINNTINVNELYSVTDSSNMSGVHASSTANNLIFKDNTITVNGESTLYGLKLDSNANTITNNNITVTTTGTATGVELTGNDNTVTDNTIIANDKKGDAAVNAIGENNIVENNAPLTTSLKVIAPATANINEATPITILLKDNTGKLIPEQEIKVTVGDNEAETVTTDEDGIAVYNLTATTSGELNLTITYEGQGVYTGSETTVTINVNEDKDAIIEELNNTIKEQEETINSLNETVNNQTEAINELNNTVNEQAQTITEQEEAIAELNNTINNQTQTIEEQAQAINELNNTVNNQTQTIEEQAETISELNDTINNQTQTIEEQAQAINELNNTVNNQTQTIEEQADAISELNDTVNNQTAAIEDLENSVEALTDIINNLTSTKASTITLDAVEDAQVGDTITITGTLSDENGYGIPGTVKLLINNGRATVKTNVNGEFTYDYTVTKVGTYNVTASYAGTDSYTASNTTMNFDVAQQDTIIAIDEITPVKSGNNVTVTGTLLDANGNPIKGTIKLLINNGRATVKTDDTGVFTYNFVASKVGTNNITASYLESTKYLATNTTATVEVTAMDTQIVFDEISSAKKGEKITISGKLVDENGNAVTGTIKLLINNGRATVKTNENGVFTYEYTVTKVGVNNITASYLGANRYTATEATTTAQVEKLATTITLNNIGTVTQKSMVEISGKLADENGKAITGTIKLLINNGRKTIKTDNTGAFTYSHNATFAGENTITANYLESTNYLPTNSTTTFTVTKA